MFCSQAWGVPGSKDKELRTSDPKLPPHLLGLHIPLAKLPHLRTRFSSCLCIWHTGCYTPTWLRLSPHKVIKGNKLPLPGLAMPKVQDSTVSCCDLPSEASVPVQRHNTSSENARILAIELSASQMLFLYWWEWGTRGKSRPVPAKVETQNTEPWYSYAGISEVTHPFPLWPFSS